MKWLIKHGIILYITFVLLSGILMILFRHTITIPTSTWSILLIIYIIILSHYIKQYNYEE